MKALIATIFSIFILATNAFNQELNKTIFSERANSIILIGHCNRDAFTFPEFQAWFDENYESYFPDEKIVKALSLINTEEINITLVMGTWCSDSRREVPRLYRIFDEIGFPENQVSLINVNTEKLLPGEDISKLQIERVPTIIVYKNKKETGRIIETPEKSLEEDLIELLK
ncbi:MAG: thioredoxin family protein [Bacteroidales bacterium]|nr:thioredoxin family protein [Bacteroidales bacterium]